MQETRTWVCPKLCGCELKITAQWASEVKEDGKMYQHPVGFTITYISIENVCAEHLPLTESIGPDPYGGKPGYIKLPINDPTPAQCLYVNLYHCHGSRHRLLCGCQWYEYCDKHDIDNTRETKEHPHKTVRCEDHANEIDFSKAILEHNIKSVENSKAEEVEKAIADIRAIENAKAILLANGIDLSD